VRDRTAYLLVTFALALCGWAAVLGLTDSASASVATRHKGPMCVVYRCTTLAADAQVRVYRATPRHPGREGYEYKSTFAQWLSTGRVTALGDAGGFGGAALISLGLSGRYVAYALVEEGDRYQETGSSWAVVRLNAQSGHHESESLEFGPKSQGVTDIVATPAGSVAWIQEGSFQNPMGPPLPGEESVLPPGSKAVFYLPYRSNAPQALAVSPTIVPKSLAAIPGHLYWTEAGAARSASIP
jgi:hypothetical protein